MKFLGIVLVALTAVFAVSAQTTNHNPFVGTWKLNPAKSKFNPGPPVKSEIVTIGEDGKVAVESVAGSGNNESWSYTYVEGQEAPIAGIDNSSVVEKRSGNTVRHTWKFNGQNSTGKGVISKNGEVMTYTLDGMIQRASTSTMSWCSTSSKIRRSALTNAAIVAIST